ncbi:hypothetical protein E1B28_007305 [Marasmius oreades]|uniref:F-box domain-containing protein n=1 Tax=Marasmius oreades TaxID=181124 RepID=A0A9P7S1K0_9AGAR|nr:uncharacterized protein E1B28_007305 [Marasmius oreades]KAG7093642.1 hypothetical protein E1B28_007305 [Marasmius oreades]
MPSRRRLNYVRRYKVPDDVLILVLGYLDPPSLWRACKAFKRIHALVKDFSDLRYKYELAILGMKDGPVAHARVPPVYRLQLLNAYRQGWGGLSWTYESKAQIPQSTRAGASGGFLQQIKENGGNTVLDLMELPSTRTNRLPASTRHLRYISSGIESLAIDQVQALIITSHAFSHQGQIGIQLHFRDLWNFNKHPRACAPSYEFSTQVSSRLRRIDITICGSKVAISLEFSGARMKHLIMSWFTFDARWLDDEDVLFLDETYLLGINRRSGIPLLCLYNISKPSAFTILREFELPEAWDRSVIEFCPNSSPRSDFSLSPSTVFYLAPETRILAIKSRKSSRDPQAPYTPNDWLFIKESYFKHMSRRDPFRMAWKQWGQYCLAKEVMNYPPSTIRGPYIVGSKVFYVENTLARVTGSRSTTLTVHGGSRLHAIDFSPFTDYGEASGQNWVSNGPKAGLIPSEYSKSIHAAVVDGLSIEDVSVTEDNIILFTMVGISSTDSISKALDPEEILNSSLNTLYGYQPITLSSSGSLFEYTLHSGGSWSGDNKPSTLVLRTPDTRSSNWSLHASSIWASSRYLADHFDELGLPDLIGDKEASQPESSCFRLLELGAGAGLPGIVIAKTHQRLRVTISDYPDQQLIETLCENISRNAVEGNCKAIAYAWGSESNSLCDDGTHPQEPTRLFDMIIAADTVWNPDLHCVFIDSLKMLLKRTEGACIHLVAGLHTGRYTLQSFIRAVAQAGLVVESAIERELNGCSSRPWNVKKAEEEDEKERRQWVVWITIRWPMHKDRE